MQGNIRCSSKLDWCIVATSSLVFASCPRVHAQSNIVPDNTLGNEASIVTPDAGNPLN